MALAGFAHLSPASSSSSVLRRSPSRPALSTTPSRPLRTADRDEDPAMHGDDQGDSPTHRVSLAHELAAALMPEPSTGSRLLADEFGLEFDEGAEGGVDDDEPDDGATHDLTIHTAPQMPNDVHDRSHDHDPWRKTNGNHLHDFAPAPAVAHASLIDEEDALTLLTKDLASTELFLAHLRCIDLDAPRGVSSQPASPHNRTTFSGHARHPSLSAHEPHLEKLAGDVIRRLNETARTREGQVRELRECERAFRQIAGEVGGSDVLGELDELEHVDGLGDAPRPRHSRTSSADSIGSDTARQPSWDDGTRHALTDLEEEPEEDELDKHGDEYDEHDLSPPMSPSPIASSHPAPPLRPPGPPTPSTALPELAYMRTLTGSLVSSLGAIAEQAQVNGAGAADAGRKLRALRNKIGGWKTDWESAERSRKRIEEWERGTPDLSWSSTPASSRADSPTGPSTPPARGAAKRIVEEQLSAFAVVLAEAHTRTQAIMAAA